MTIDHEQVRENVRRADTEDLLDRLTVFQAGMEQEALDLIEAELRARGVTTEQIRDHEERRAGEVLWEESGLAYRCSLCHRPAVARGVMWRRLFWLVPVFPRPAYFCSVHRPRRGTVTS
jgi:acetylornithine deacetylase/succinyl-diaminopimelate desuccinylase-like protein